MNETYALDIAKGKIHFPMAYSQGSTRFYLLWAVLLALNALICGVVVHEFRKAVNKFDFQTALSRIRESSKKFSPKLLSHSILRYREKKTL